MEIGRVGEAVGAGLEGMVAALRAASARVPDASADRAGGPSGQPRHRRPAIVHRQPRVRPVEPAQAAADQDSGGGPSKIDARCPRDRRRHELRAVKDRAADSPHPGPQNRARQVGLVRGTGSASSAALAEASSAVNPPSSCATAPIVPDVEHRVLAASPSRPRRSRPARRRSGPAARSASAINRAPARPPSRRCRGRGRRCGGSRSASCPARRGVARRRTTGRGRDW